MSNKFVRAISLSHSTPPHLTPLPHPGRPPTLLPTPNPQRLPRPRRRRLLPTTLRLPTTTTLRPTGLRRPTTTATTILPTTTTTTTTRPIRTATGRHDVRAATAAAAGVLCKRAPAETGGRGGGVLCGAVGVGGLLLLFGFSVLGEVGFMDVGGVRGANVRLFFFGGRGGAVRLG